jgi:hypothetical protein
LCRPATRLSQPVWSASRKAGLGDLGSSVGPELVQRVVDYLPDMAVGVGEEPVGAAQRGSSGILDHDPTGPDGCLERGVDLLVAGHVNRQDGLAGRLARQRSGHLRPTELGQQLVGTDQQEAAGRLEEEWSRVVDRDPGMITRRLPDPALVGRSAPPS